MDDKTYTQEIVQELPFPQEVVVPVTQSSQSGDSYTPTVSKDKNFPVKRTAIELLSTALNTRSKKILQEFELEQSGGIKVGNYQEGISGDIRITPNGIVGRNTAGITTFGIDGDDGSAVFSGELRAGTIIVANTIITEQASSGNGRTVYYNDGIPAIVIGDPN